MISKKWQKLINSLQYKKYRKEENLFLVEGSKSVIELLESDFKIKMIFYTDIFAKKYKIPSFIPSEILSITELKSISLLENNQEVLAVVEQKNIRDEINTVDIRNGIILALDSIQDPGNLGTIIRIADWYGINKIVCNEETVDFYNPKVIAASMGSFTRVSMYYTNLLVFLQNEFQQGNTIYGTLLDGDSIYEVELKKFGIILMGNEANGISKQLFQYITQRIRIPKIGKAESLNVGIATAVVLDNFFRK